MNRAFPLLLLSLASGCMHVETTTRVERGPMLRSFEREQVVEGGARATVTAKWPELTVGLRGHDTCRVQTVEEYAEEQTTERTSRSAGPALSAGIVNGLAGIILLSVSQFVSNDFNKSMIDINGRFPPSPRQQVRSGNWVPGRAQRGPPRSFP